MLKRAKAERDNVRMTISSDLKIPRLSRSGKLNAEGDRKMQDARHPAHKKSRLPFPEGGVSCIRHRRGDFLVLGRPGSDLLSQGLSHSTIGAEEFNGRVRDGIGFKLLARTTRPAKDKDTKQTVLVF